MKDMENEQEERELLGDSLVGKSARKLLEDYISEKEFSSPNQIAALYELALPVVEWLIKSMTEKNFRT